MVVRTYLDIMKAMRKVTRKMAASTYLNTKKAIRAVIRKMAATTPATIPPTRDKVAPSESAMR